MTTPLEQYRALTYDLTVAKLRLQANVRKTWLQQRLTKSANQPTKK